MVRSLNFCLKQRIQAGAFQGGGVFVFVSASAVLTEMYIGNVPVSLRDLAIEINIKSQ